MSRRASFAEIPAPSAAPPAPLPVSSNSGVKSAVAPPAASSTPALGSRSKFKSIVVMLVVAVAVMFLVRTIAAARKKKASRMESKTNETHQWQSYFAEGASAPSFDAPPAHHPAPPAHHPAPPAYHPAPPVHTVAPSPLPPSPHIAHVSHRHHRPIHTVPPGDSNIAGGRPVHSMIPQSTRPPRENENIGATPPADISPSQNNPQQTHIPAPPAHDDVGPAGTDFTEI
jgi:hypothetical protein